METAPDTLQIETIASAEANVTIESPWTTFWRRLRRQRIAPMGGIILVVLYVATLFSGFIAPYSDDSQDRPRFFHQPMALRFQGARLAVQNYEPGSGTSKYQPVKGQVTPL